MPTADLVLGDPQISILEGVVLPWGEPSGYLRKVVLPTLARTFKFDPAAPWGDLPPAARKVLLCTARRGRSFKYTAEGGQGREVEGEWEGILANLSRRYRESSSDAVRQRSRRVHDRAAVPGLPRQAARPRVARGDGRRHAASATWSTCRSTTRSSSSSGSRSDAARPGAVDPDIAGPILKEVVERLAFLRDVGLDYLTLGRSAGTLSGGEAQRIRLATQIGSRLVGVLYILDEPSIGLHQRDNARLLDTLRGLRDLGNTVIVVEHDEDTIRAADHVVDLGPRAGRFGGEVVVEGTVDEVIRHPDSLTARYLRGELRIPVPVKRRPVEPRPAASGRRRTREQSPEPDGRDSARIVRGGDRRFRLGQVDAGDRHSLSVARRGTSIARSWFRAPTRASRDSIISTR